MKNIALSSFLFFAGSSLAWSQVPDSISQRFRTTNPNITDVQWQINDNSYRAIYHDEKNVQHTVDYNKNTPVRPNGTVIPDNGGKSSTPVPTDDRGIQPTSGDKSLKGTDKIIPKGTTASIQGMKHKSGDKNPPSKKVTDSTKKNKTAGKSKGYAPITSDAKTTDKSTDQPESKPQPAVIHNTNTIPPKY